MTLRLASFALLVALTGCGGDKAAPAPVGAWHALNAGQWDIDPSLAVAPAMPKAPE